MRCYHVAISIQGIVSISFANIFGDSHQIHVLMKRPICTNLLSSQKHILDTGNRAGETLFHPNALVYWPMEISINNIPVKSVQSELNEWKEEKEK